VFAIGAILYHVLAGEAPVPARSLREAAAATPRPMPDDAPAELRAIALRAMARDPAARYPSARELAEDLQRFQTGQLVSVHAYSTWSLIRRFVRRHRAAVTIAAALLAVIATVATCNQKPARVLTVLRSSTVTRRPSPGRVWAPVVLARIGAVRVAVLMRLLLPARG